MATEEEFKKKIRVFFKFLKAYHHELSIRELEEHDRQPDHLVRLARQAAGSIRPALPSMETDWLTYGNARNWLHTGTQILQGHYEQALWGARIDLQNEDQVRWNEAWEVAVKWGRRSIKGLKNRTIGLAGDQVRAAMTGRPDLGTTAAGAQGPGRDQSGAQGEAPGPEIEVEVPPEKRQLQEQGDQGTRPVASGSRPVPLPRRKRPTGRRGIETPQVAQEQQRQVESAGAQQEQVPMVVEPQIEQEPLVGVTEGDDLLEEGPEDLAQAQDLSLDGLDIGESPVWLLEEDEMQGLDKDIELSKAVDTRESVPQAPQAEKTREGHKETGSHNKSLHLNHVQKSGSKLNWELAPVREILLVGDSNLGRIPVVRNRRIEIDSFPGANLAQAYALVKHRTLGGVEVKQLILSFGLNNRRQGDRINLQQAIGRLREAATVTFPNAVIKIPAINFSSNLPEWQRTNLKIINELIMETGWGVPPLPDRSFRTEADGIHWTASTAEAMLQHWLNSFGL
ncbi:MAG: hypothetical protein ACRDC4_11955, partial [Plesiomonas sp.]